MRYHRQFYTSLEASIVPLPEAAVHWALELDRIFRESIDTLTVLGRGDVPRPDPDFTQALGWMRSLERAGIGYQLYSLDGQDLRIHAPLGWVNLQLLSVFLRAVVRRHQLPAFCVRWPGYHPIHGTPHPAFSPGSFVATARHIHWAVVSEMEDAILQSRCGTGYLCAA